MYLLAALCSFLDTVLGMPFILIFAFILTKLGVIFDTAFGASSVITIAIKSLIRIAFGFFANALYYRAVKSKIKKDITSLKSSAQPPSAPLL